TRVITHPAYAEVLELSKNEDSGIDLRQVVHTGMKPENVMGPDLIDDWAKIGNKLFNGNGVIPFVRGNIFCNSFFDRSTPSHPASMDSTSIQLNQLESLNPLKQKARFITCNSVFHLFDEERQTELARRLASLLNDQKSGSTIFGTHVGSDDFCFGRGEWFLRSGKTGKRGMFMHSPETWKKMWEKIYQPGEARIQVELQISVKPAFGKIQGSDVNAHVGETVKVNSPDGPVPPLVTGTFAGAGFCFSMLGEASDKLSSASTADLTAQLDGAQDANRKPGGINLGMIKALMSKLPLGGGKADVQHDLDTMDATKTCGHIDQLAPGDLQDFLGALQRIEETIQVLSMELSPTTLSRESMKYDIIVFSQASDPTHGVLAKIISRISSTKNNQAKSSTDVVTDQVR
ncbi:hypothetical protein PSTT_02551, partial [Puccinia striiformis]